MWHEAVTPTAAKAAIVTDSSLSADEPSPHACHEPPLFLTWDEGRLLVAPEFASILHAAGLRRLVDFMQLTQGVLVREVRRRSTVHLTLETSQGRLSCYLKRYGEPSWRDTVKPYLSFGAPIWGAETEWRAILGFRQAGIPTMTPVAFGHDGRESFVMTVALEDHINLRDWLLAQLAAPQPDAEPLAMILKQVAALAKQMHDAGWQHQDFYLNHLLLDRSRAGEFVPQPDGPVEGGANGPSIAATIRVIDLGRARQHATLPLRWVIKDLSQLDFSARELPCRTRLRFLRQYLGRKFTRADRRLVRLIALKSAHIARHTQKHGL